MYMQKYLLTAGFFVLLMLLLGCSQSTSPVTLENKTESQAETPIVSLTNNIDSFNAIGLMGVYELTIDPEDLSVDMIAKRTNTIGESYLVSGISFFTVSPCVDCLQLLGFTLDSLNGLLTMTFSIDHPFDPGNPSFEPSAKNRLDLHVFDLSMVIVPLEMPETIFPLTGVGAYTDLCANCDGYTSALANLTNDFNACPYFLVIDDTDSDPITSTFNKFEMGTKNALFEVCFKESNEPISVDMYMIMGYGYSATRIKRFNPKYYNPEYNFKAAWKVEVIPPNGDNPPDSGNTWQENDNTTLHPVTVKVWDWQAGATVWDGVDKYELADPSHVYTASEVEKVIVEIPGMTSALPESLTADSGTGTPDDPLIYTVSFANENLIPADDYTGLVKVLDSRAPGVIGDRDFLIDSPDGILLINYEIPEYATYQTFSATVFKLCGPINGQIEDPPCPVAGLNTNEMVDFTVSASSANGGNPIVLYEIDIDYNGSSFNADDSNTTGIFRAGPFIPPDPCDSNIPYTFTVAFRATDSCDPPNVEIFATCDVTVETCCYYQELYYNWDGCDGDTCMGWECGGCGLSNTADQDYGGFSWRCPKYSACNDVIVPPYLTPDWSASRNYCLGFSNSNTDVNVVSPTINLPPSSDAVIEWDHCFTYYLGNLVEILISENGCSGPWTSLQYFNSNGCHNPSIDISSYSGSNIKFRFRYWALNGCWDSGQCTSTGVIIDNVLIHGCFEGTLSD